jgi:sialic acid synthase SpsE/sugar phosphate isomerase/epimerase
MNIQIGRFNVGESRVFTIAEIGNNHNGSFDRAIEMIDLAIKVGVDCVKFQMRNLGNLYREKSLNLTGEDLGTEYVLDLLKRFELSEIEHKKLKEYCDTRGILYMCTPWDSASIRRLEEFGVSAYKVASADLTNIPLIAQLSDAGKPLILSTGMSTQAEIKFTVDFLYSRGVKFALLHCNSTYPAPFYDINLNWIGKLREIHPLVGYSGHERGIAVSLAAAGLGACIIERHFTLDRAMEGPDHAASLEFVEFKALVDGVREIEKALGTGGERLVSQGEMINRENLGKSLVASRSLSKGSVITPEDILVKSPGQGISPQYYEQLIGRVLQRNLDYEDYFYLSDIGSNREEPRDYRFDRPWGIPVRYHDFKEYQVRIKPDLYEFHLSYSDMELNPEQYLNLVEDCDFVVHAPELFANSHLMDLASPDEGYRNQSIQNTQRVINITRDIKKYFPKTQRPLIVANIGGFTMDRPLEKEELPNYYKRFSASLSELDLDGVELIPQTMAPFPWHFGGQRYQNIFVRPDEITYWCKQLNLRMCLDISHSRLMSNYFQIDFYHFLEQVAPITAHIHLGDAKGINGEGLQIGDGDIDFKRVSKIFQEYCPKVSFIPEIWQGHKNQGEGFWLALNKLEEFF